MAVNITSTVEIEIEIVLSRVVNYMKTRSNVLMYGIFLSMVVNMVTVILYYL